ncbi:MAG: hypothetical protein JWN67_3305, partial [Actinomycetia bacterium]|nr:hypothetical protein [Actinomycetes bacterium]
MGERATPFDGREGCGEGWRQVARVLLAKQPCEPDDRVTES